MAPYILMDQPEIPATEALEKSKQMTYGHKWEIFVMQLSFIGWGILSSLTFGILGIFFTGPYMMITMAGYYVVLRNQQVSPMGGVQPENQGNPYMGYNPSNDVNNSNPYTQGMDDTF